MSEDFDWGEYAVSSGYQSWQEPGDELIGTILVVRQGEDYNGNPCPELIVRTEDAEDITVTAGQAILRNRLAEQRPQKGDRIRIAFVGYLEAQKGKQPAKDFEVQVHQGGGAKTIRDMQEAAKKATRPDTPDEAPF